MTRPDLNNWDYRKLLEKIPSYREWVRWSNLSLRCLVKLYDTVLEGL